MPETLNAATVLGMKKLRPNTVFDACVMQDLPLGSISMDWRLSFGEQLSHDVLDGLNACQ